MTKKIIKNGLSVILPVYNEKENIPTLIKNITNHLSSNLENFEIILINDGSIDGSYQIAKNLALKYPELNVINLKYNFGVGYAVRKGIEKAKYEWLHYIDSDGQFKANEIKKFWNNRLSYDFIIGYRKKRKDNLYRKLVGKTGNIIANLFLNPPYTIIDINCGFKLFQTEDLKNMPFISTGGIFNFEILLYLIKNKNKTKYSQLPVSHYKRTKGTQTGGTINVIINIIVEGIQILLKFPKNKKL